MNVGQTTVLKTVCVTTHTQSCRTYIFVWAQLIAITASLLNGGMIREGGAGQSVSTTANRP